MKEWAWHRQHNAEVALLDAAVSAGSLEFHVRPEQLPAETRRAFIRWRKRIPIEKWLSGFKGASETSRQGALNNLVGRTFEDRWANRVNAGKRRRFMALFRKGHSAGIALSKRQKVVLPPNPNNPGIDAYILNADGTIAEGLQLKMTATLSVIKKALDKGYRVVTSSEAAQKAMDQGLDNVIDSGMSWEELRNELGPLEKLLDSPSVKIAKRAAAGFPFVLIVTSEGGKYVMGRQTFQDALNHGLSRGLRPWFNWCR